MKDLASPKKGKSKSKSRIKKTSKKAKSPTASVVERSSRKLKTAPKKETKTKKKNLETTIKETILKLKPIAQKAETGKATKQDLESAIQDVIGSLIPVSEEEKRYSLKKFDLEKEISDKRASLQKIPEKVKKKKVLKKDLESAINDVISNLESVSEKDKKHALTKEDLETTVMDVLSSLRPVAEDKIIRALSKKDFKTTIRDAKADLKPVPEEIMRPQMSSKQLRTSIKDARIRLKPISEEIISTDALTLEKTIKEEGAKIKRELLPIPGDVEIFEIIDLEHIKEFSADKSDFNNLINHMINSDKKSLLKFIINPRTKFNKIELIDENDPISIDNIIAGGDLVQFGQAYRFLLKNGYIKIENPYTFLLSDEYWYVWHLKEEINLTFVDIAYARNASIRDIRGFYQKAEERIEQILDFVIQGGHYQLVAAHAMKKKGILVQKVGDTVIEPKIEDYLTEESMLKEMLETGYDIEEEEFIPQDWFIKASYKKETFTGGRYLWKEWLGALNNDNLLLMENDELPTEEIYLQEALGFGADVPPDIYSNFEKLIDLFKNVPEELIKIGDAAYFIGNINSLYSSHFWDYKNFTSPANITDWRRDFIRLAIKSYQTALKKYTLDHYPINYAKTQNDLGNFLASLAEIEDKADNCKLAIFAYKESLEIFSSELFRFNYSQVNFNLGLAHQTLAELEEKSVNSQFAIIAYKNAIKGRDLTNYPFEFAISLVNQGSAYQTLAESVEKGLYSTFAIDSYNGALRAESLDKMPSEQAMIYSNIGASYKILAEVQEKKHNCNQAILVLNDALTIRNSAQYPFEYAISTTILGDVYSVLATEINKDDNCKMAISAYNKTIKVFIKKHEDFYENVVSRKQKIEKFKKK